MEKIEKYTFNENDLHVLKMNKVINKYGKCAKYDFSKDELKLIRRLVSPADFPVSFPYSKSTITKTLYGIGKSGVVLEYALYLFQSKIKSLKHDFELLLENIDENYHNHIKEEMEEIDLEEYDKKHNGLN